MKLISKPLFQLLLFLSVISCQIGTIEPTDKNLGKNYYPLKIGNYIIYDVKLVFFHELIEHDSSVYQLKEVVADTFRNAASELTYRIERFKRTIVVDTWELDSVWTSRLDQNTRYIRTENNIPFIRYVLPSENGVNWNANALNTLDEDTYIVEDFNKKFEIENFLFDNTIKINQKFDTSSISKDDRLEIYADTIGLVYKRSEILEYVADSEDDRYKQYFIIGGRFLEQKYFEHGKE